MRFFLFFLISALFLSEGSAQQEDYYTEEYFRYSTHIYDTNIHSLQVHRRGAPLSEPVAKLNHLTKVLELSFDDFRDKTRDYRYTFIHCDAYWNPSDIIVSDYLQGFDDDYIEEYEFSYNTRQPFIHYKLHFPQRDMLPVLSGNYLLKVFPAGSPDKPILTARFMVLDEKVSVQPNIRQATAPTKMEEWHEVDFVINTQSFYMANPSRNMSVVVQQNGRHDNKITGIKPSEIQGNEYIFDYEDKNLFRAGNEFRHFEIQNLKYQSDQVKRIDIFGNQNQVYLYPDKRRTFSSYIFKDDINGKRLIKTTEYDNTDTEADYAYVHFALPMENPVINGSIHILGGLNYWELNSRSKMTYNYQTKAYENTMYLKQGYYNYLYAYKEDGQPEANVRLIENSFYETENEYTFYVYYNHPGTSYDQLVGKKTVSSGE